MPTDTNKMKSTGSALDRLDDWRERNREAGLSVLLVLQAITMFVVSPLAGAGIVNGSVVEALRFGLAATAILIVNRSRIVGALVALTFVVSMVCAAYLRTGTASDAVYLANIGITIVFELTVAWIVARAVFAKGLITVHRIMGAVILYLYIGLIFASLYRLAVSVLYPSFSGLGPNPRGNLSELLYFSLGTLTTSGAGQVMPLHPILRSLANLESVIGQLYPATFVARLVTLHGAAADGGCAAGQRPHLKRWFEFTLTVAMTIYADTRHHRHRHIVQSPRPFGAHIAKLRWLQFRQRHR